MNLSIKYTDPETVVNVTTSIMNTLKLSTKMALPEKSEDTEELFNRVKLIVTNALRSLMKGSTEFHITFDLSDFIGDVCDFVALEMGTNDEDSRSDSENGPKE